VGAERERVTQFGRLEDGLGQGGEWYRWGPYVSERQWGTVREDYSADGNAWDYLPHDHARSRQSRAMLTTLMLSFGVPMLLGGDEMGRTQDGNNNAYCQDNELTWLNWASADTALLDYTRHLIALRRALPLGRRDPGAGPPCRWVRRSAGVCGRRPRQRRDGHLGPPSPRPIPHRRRCDRCARPADIQRQLGHSPRHRRPPGAV